MLRTAVIMANLISERREEPLPPLNENVASKEEPNIVFFDGYCVGFLICGACFIVVFEEGVLD